MKPMSIGTIASPTTFSNKSRPGIETPIPGLFHETLLQRVYGESQFVAACGLCMREGYWQKILPKAAVCAGVGTAEKERRVWKAPVKNCDAIVKEKQKKISIPGTIKIDTCTT